MLALAVAIATQSQGDSQGFCQGFVTSCGITQLTWYAASGLKPLYKTHSSLCSCRDCRPFLLLAAICFELAALKLRRRHAL